MADETDPLFGGVPSIPPPEAFERARTSNPGWVEVLRKAVSQFAAMPENAGIYADPESGRGATIQQTWLFQTLLGVRTYCLLARPLPAASTQKITRLVKRSAAEIIDALRSIQAAEGQLHVTVAYHDGATGHCIELRSHDPARDRFVYHDPWPERSLLAKENNPAGVDAQPEGKQWSVTAAELERVLFAAFVFPAQWARVQGEVFDLPFEDWKDSEFFKFFRLTQLDQRSEAGHVTRIFAPQAFQNEMALLVGCRESGKIVRTALRLNSEWVINNLALALDLVKSYVMSFAPVPDRATYSEIADAFRKLRDPGFLIAAKDVDPNASDGMRCVHAFMGSSPETVVSTDFASLAVGTTSDAEGTMPYLEFQLF
jgi:hypothetical protein